MSGKKIGAWKVLLIFGLLFLNASLPGFAAGRSQDYKMSEVPDIIRHYTGVWKTYNEYGDAYTLTIYKDYTVESSLNPGEREPLSLKNEKIYIEWRNGWKDLLEWKGELFHRDSFAPGRSFDDKPSYSNFLTRIRSQEKDSEKHEK